MKIKKILSLVCSAALVATALSTGAILTNADEQSAAIRVDFSDYTITSGTSANSSDSTAFSLKDGDNGNKYLNFKCDSNIEQTKRTTFLVDPNGKKDSTRLENNTTYYLTIKYKFNQLAFSDTDASAPDRLCPYIRFSANLWDQLSDIGETQPVNGLWTKYGYYVNSTTSSQPIKDAIGMGSMETANGADIWKEYETDNDGWTTGTLSFTTNSTAADNNMYFGFMTNCYGIYGKPTVDYDIDYIEITKALENDADAYAKNNNTYLDFSAYNSTEGNYGGALTVVDAAAVTGATGNKVAKIEKSITNGWQANFRLSLTPHKPAANSHNRLTAENTYELEARYKLGSCKDSNDTDMSIGVLLTFGTNHYSDLLGNTLFGGDGNGISTSNPTGNFWDESVIDNDGWVTAKLQFTAPEAADGTRDTYFTFADTENGLSTGTNINMYIDYINIRLAAPVTIDNVKNSAFGVPGETMTALAKEAKKEVYEEKSAKATATETVYYSDSECTTEVDLTSEKYGVNTVLYSKAKTMVDGESQAAFCGFDDYRLRTATEELKDNDKWSFYEGVEGAAGFSSDSFSITSADSYTGTKSLLYSYKDGTDANANRDAKVAYIGNGYDLIPGKTYELSFWYKPAENNEAEQVKFCFTSGRTWNSYAQSNNTSAWQTAKELKTQNDWRQAKLIWTCTIDKPNHIPPRSVSSFCAPVIMLGAATEQTAIYFDSFVISEVATYDGAAKLNTVDNDGKQAIRFKYSYDTVAGEDTVKIAGEAFTVAERGILVKSANNTADLVRNTTANGVMKAVKTDKFDECWNYNAETGKYEFSMYIKGLDANDSRELVSRAYVVLKDSAGNETVFYSETSTTSVEKITEIIESKTTAE